MKQCAWLLCGKPFEPPKKSNRRAIYCSSSCRLHAHRSRHGMIVSRTPVASDDRFTGIPAQDDRFNALPQPAPVSLPVLSPEEMLVVQSRWQPCVAPLPPGIEPDDLLIPKELLR
jgi:hypothetical protein